MIQKVHQWVVSRISNVFVNQMQVIDHLLFLEISIFSMVQIYVLLRFMMIVHFCENFVEKSFLLQLNQAVFDIIKKQDFELVHGLQKQIFHIFSYDGISSLASHSLKNLIMLYYCFYIQIIVMFLHQALPKDAQAIRKPTYQIRRKFSPKHREKAANNPQDNSSLSNIKADSIEKTHIHIISSKQKPIFSSTERKNRSPVPKQINLICMKKSDPKIVSHQQERIQVPQMPLNSLDQNELTFRQDNEIHRFVAKQNTQKAGMILCKVQNRACRTVDCSFLYSDLSTIDQAYWLAYQGQTTGNRVRHGFGTQIYTNGEKFVGIFSDNKANGQGTYYSLKKKIMGCWQNDRLKEVILQL